MNVPQNIMIQTIICCAVPFDIALLLVLPFLPLSLPRLSLLPSLFGYLVSLQGRLVHAPSMEEAIGRRLASGGYEQTMHSMRGLVRRRTRQSTLAFKLLEMWCCGGVSAPAVQTIAAAAMSDMHQAAAEGPETLSDLAALAALGASGSCLENCRRDLLRQFCIPLEVLPPLVTRMPCIDTREDKSAVIFASAPVFMPNEIFERLYRHHAPLFQEIFGTAALAAFWDSRRDDDPRLIGHPMVQQNGWRDIYVPLSVFGDAVQYTTRGDSLQCFCFGGLLGGGWGPRNIFLAAIVPKRCCCTEEHHGVDTMAHFWSHIAHGFRALFDGVHPVADVRGLPWPRGSPQAELAGRPICDGRFRAVVWNIVADLEYAANELRLPHWNNVRPCWLCRAERSAGPLNVRNFALDAAWRTTGRPCGCRAVPNHPVWTIPGMSVFMHTGDWMHCVDLGVASYLCASAMQELVEPGGPFGRGTFESRVESLWRRLRHHYTRTGTTKQLGNLTGGMIGGQGAVFPALAAKAAETRHLLYPLRSLVEELNDGSERAGHRLACFDELLSIITLLQLDERARPPLRLPEPDAEEAYACANRFCLHYNALTSMSIDRGRPLYNPAFKLHLFLHLVFHARYLPPRLSWAYPWEDFVGRAKRLAVSSSSGTRAYKLPPKIMAQYRVMLAANLHGRTQV